MLLSLVLILSNSSFLIAKPKSNDTEKKEPAVYKKYIHPREYTFDLADSKNKVSLKVDSTSGKAYCNVDFTEFVREQMPRKGDKITFTYDGSASKDVEAITGVIYDLTKGENLGNKVPEIITTKVSKKENFKKSFSLILKSDAEKNFTLRLTGTLPESNKKVDKVDLNFKRVTESTNTKKELEAEKQAIKNGQKIVYVKSNFKVVEKNTEVKTEIQPETEQDSVITPEVQVTLEKEPEPETDTTEIHEVESEEVSVVSEEKESEEIVETQVVIENEVPETSIELVEVEPVPAVEEMIEVPELEPVQEKIVIKIEPAVIPETPKKEVAETKKVEESTYEPIIVKSKVSRYEKEYLQDYLVMDELETYDNEIEEKVDLIENPDKKDSKGRTALMLASKNGDKALIKRLLQSGANVNITDNDGWTPLMYAARYQTDLNCFDLLIEATSDIKLKNKYGLSALILSACYNKNPQILERLIKYYSPSDKEVTKSFVLLLTECTNSTKTQLDKIKIFVDYSVPINTFYNGKTPLMYAAEYSSSTKIIRLLLENNAKIEIRSTEGKTAFDYAVSNSKLEHDNVYWTLNKK